MCEVVWCIEADSNSSRLLPAGRGFRKLLQRVRLQRVREGCSEPAVWCASMVTCKDAATLGSLIQCSLAGRQALFQDRPGFDSETGMMPGSALTGSAPPGCCCDRLYQVSAVLASTARIQLQPWATPQAASTACGCLEEPS